MEKINYYYFLHPETACSALSELWFSTMNRFNKRQTVLQSVDRNELQSVQQY